MSNERNYIYLEKIMKRVPIHAVAGTYIWKIGDASYKIDAAIERILVYELYTGRANNNFFELARVNLQKKVFANTSPALISSSFIEEHPCFDLKEYDYSIIPEYADPEKGMWLHGDGNSWSFWITLEDEKFLLSRLKDATPWNNCKSYLRSIPARYAMTLDEVSIIESLACFCKQHGIDPNSLREKDRSNKQIGFQKVRERERNEWLKTSEYAKQEWLKYHPEDKEKFDNAYKPQKQEKPHNQENDGKVFSGVMGVISFLALAGLWIALFSGVDMDFGFIVLPVFTASSYTFATMYFKESESFDKICLFFVICIALNVIASIVGWFSSEANISGTAIFNIILSALMFGFMTKNW